ncbi:MAG: hypothetical protein Tsb0021_10000 [Chlamydiales bacterium]
MQTIDFQNSEKGKKSSLNHSATTQESSLVYYFERFGMKGLMIFGISIVSLIFSGFYLKFNRMDSLVDFMKTELHLSHVLQGKNPSDQNLDFLNLPLNLQQKYDGILAQHYMLYGFAEKAQLYFDRLTERVNVSQLKFYQEYGLISLLIAKNNYNQALEKSIKLKGQINPFSREYLNLYALNLLNIALLEQKSGSLLGERDAWLELKEMMENSENTAIKAKLDQQFREGKVGLLDYIDARLNIIDSLSP